MCPRSRLALGYQFHPAETPRMYLMGKHRNLVERHPPLGKGPSGKAPLGWVSGTHQSRPEARDERAQVRGGDAGRDRGQRRGHAVLQRRVTYLSTRV